jgi:hypothetical protein
MGPGMPVINLLALFTWLAVSQDCHGAAEPFPPVYEVRVWQAAVTGSHVGPDGGLWPTYTRLDERTLIPGTAYALPEPAVGGVVAWWDPVAVDAAGNRSDQPCN